MNLYANESLFTTIDSINETSYKVCCLIPPHIVSDGIWGGKFDGRNVMKSSLPLFELQVLVIYAVTQICGFFFKFLDLPAFLPQMVAGIILGPTIRQETLDKYKKLLFPYGSQDTLATLTSMGYVLFIFITAVQMDMSLITRTGHKAWTITLTGLIATTIIGVSAAVYLFPQLSVGDEITDLPDVVISNIVPSFAVSASLLNELKITSSELGRMALSSVLVSDAVTIFTGCVMSAIDHKDLTKTSFYVTALIAMFVLVPLICQPVMKWIVRNTPEGRPVSNGYIYIIIVMVFALGCAAVELRQDFALGAFVLGLAVPAGPPLGSALVKKLHFFGSCFLLPIFVTCNMMKADLSVVASSNLTLIVASFVYLTHLIKIIISVVTAVFCKMPFRDALVLALILNYKGVVQLCLYSGLYDSEVISSRTFAEMVISIMITSCLVKWSVKLLYDPSIKYAGYQKRNIMDLKPDSEMRILACIHKKYNVPAVTDVLDICCPTEKQPIIVDALHIIELVGRTAPVFISHRIQKKDLGSEVSYSDEINLAFDLYEHDNLGRVTTHTYTSLSLPTMMHDDVCQLAMDKVASFMILPFHKRWSTDGTIESNDKNIRSLNCKILETAPCSVGILVSRSTFQSDSPCIRLAMVYVGGHDCIEALSLAKRAMGEPRIKLVVYHLVHDEYMQDVHDLLDNAVLQDVKRPPLGVENVKYQRVKTNHGSETSAILRNIVCDHDLFIVGMRHGMGSPQTEGLSDWSEFPELGVIGDLLASPDFESRASILAVQQQQQKTKSRIRFN